MKPVRDTKSEPGLPVVISRIFFIYFTVIGVKKIVRYIEDFVIQRFFKSRFHYSMESIPKRSLFTLQGISQCNKVIRKQKVIWVFFHNKLI